MSPFERSWLFEVVDVKAQTIVSSFTLILPPQNYSIKEPQRVAITKTFGTTRIDDYGPDNSEITLRGISGSSRVFPTFRSAGRASENSGGFAALRTAVTMAGLSPSEGYDQRSAFFTFRDDIMRYKERGYRDRELHVYDLYDEQAYNCALLEFSLERTAEKPLQYPFSISLFVIADLSTKRAYRPTPILRPEDPLQILDAVDRGLSFLNTATRFVGAVNNSVQGAANTAQLIRGRITSAISQVEYVVSSPLRLGQQLVGMAAQTIRDAHRTLELGRFTFEQYADFVRMSHGTLQRALALWGVSLANNTQQGAQGAVLNRGVVEPGEAGQSVTTSSVESVQYTGFVEYTLRGGDTLQSIARNELGDEDVWPVLAAINNVADNDELEDKQMVYLPVSVEEVAIKDWFILSEDPARDPYGADLRVDVTTGKLQTSETGDLGVVAGVPNVIQAVNMRLRTPLASLARDTAYGFALQPGLNATAVSSSYLRMQVRTSLMRDPRILDVRNLAARLRGGIAQIAADIHLVGRDTTLPVTTTVGG